MCSVWSNPKIRFGHRHAERCHMPAAAAQVDREWLSRANVISHDICHRTRLTRYGGPGYQYIFRIVIPMMRRRGYSEGDVNTIMVEMPKRLLCLNRGFTYGADYLGRLR